MPPNLKNKTLDCEYSISTLMHELPQYGVMSTSSDLERNTCPVYVDAWRLIKVIHRKLQNRNIEEKKQNHKSGCSFALTFNRPSPVVKLTH